LYKLLIDFLGIYEYSGGVFVRSVISISLMIALLCSQMPAQAQMGCHHMTPTMCHRAASGAHDCGMMHNEQAVDDEQSSGASQTGTNVEAVESSSKCPMTCCFQFGARAVAVIRVAGNHFQQAIVPYTFRDPSVVFVSNGFSSHCDRGPPV